MDALLSFFWFMIGCTICVVVFLVIAWGMALLLQLLLG